MSSCEGFPNVPLMGMRGCINYNLVLTIRQLDYSMRGAPSEESIVPFIARGFSDPNAKILQRVRKAWNVVQRKDKELIRSNNGVIGGQRRSASLESRTGKNASGQGKFQNDSHQVQERV